MKIAIEKILFAAILIALIFLISLLDDSMQSKKKQLENAPIPAEVTCPVEFH